MDPTNVFTATGFNQPTEKCTGCGKYFKRGYKYIVFKGNDREQFCDVECAHARMQKEVSK